MLSRIACSMHVFAVSAQPECAWSRLVSNICLGDCHLTQIKAAIAEGVPSTQFHGINGMASCYIQLAGSGLHPRPGAEWSQMQPQALTCR